MSSLCDVSVLITAYNKRPTSSGPKMPCGAGLPWLVGVVICDDGSEDGRCISSSTPQEHSDCRHDTCGSPVKGNVAGQHANNGFTIAREEISSFS